MDSMIEQTKIIAFLENPRSYGLSGADVQRIDTHGAIVFLAGENVYKIKRAVAYPYMDFSTLEKRRRACVREMEINQPHAPDIYLKLVSITRSHDGRMAFDGDGQPIEWAVKMRRFRQEDMLNKIAERGEIDAVLATKIADTVSSYHNQAPRVRRDNLPDVLSGIAAGIAKNLAAFTNEISTKDRISFETMAQRRISLCARLLTARERTGFVRHCHGDLHLQNIVLVNGVPTLFDAIEFDDRLAQIDVFYDLAFLLADLDHRSLRTPANIVLNRYLFRQPHTMNIYALGLLPLFLALRHAIRAMVTLQRGQYVDKSESLQSVEIAKSYFADSLRCLNPVPPRLIAVGGLSGSGKSTLARNLAPHIGAAPGAIHVRTDLERKLFFKVAETERLSSACYSQEISDRIYKRLYRKAGNALKVGHGVVADGVFSTEAERCAIEDVARRLDIPFDGFWLEAPEEDLISRVENRKGDASDATARVVKMQKSAGTGPISWKKTDAGGSQERTLQSVRTAINL
ncbi:MAG: AAA family ATPase [Fimbriimonadaceae bacterium]|nr:AAA family ATPase [Alphaproteobacteria bacterium]